MQILKEIELLEKILAEKKQQAELERSKNLVGKVLEIKGIKFKIVKLRQRNKKKDGSYREYNQLYARGFYKGKNYKIHIGRKISTLEEVKDIISLYFKEKK